ncbi:type I-E CRISPR-associated endoribonuclease Cas2e [Lactiplantibacillus dongliensis]|uniref:Type I-E CRISPR-associated endoribonuclease Cas2e n=1 Tax=Lactiplantibacillus dongliensis TaxID=2559919 RepID=A0ABW1R5T9_9LACO|nr:type I-E CRISPR-associated endoribonuclease Cas2e [Lactiplantibacillus dongliensis]
MIVITLTKVPRSLRGDLTKWYQEIQTGVYVGSVSARIRDLLWDRIMKNIGRGEATMVYNSNNELGYQFRTTRQDREVVSFDGIPLMMYLNVSKGEVKHGFSNAAKFHRARVMTRRSAAKVQVSGESRVTLVSLDLETTGLKTTEDEIISIGAVRQSKDGQIEPFYQLIKTEKAVPEKIERLTGINSGMLRSKGIGLESGLKMLQEFVGELPIIGYNLRFDEAFLTNGFRKVEQSDLSNQMIDLKPIVKEANRFLDGYQLKTVLSEYNVKNDKPHNSLSDAKATLELASKLIENGVLKI